MNDERLQTIGQVKQFLVGSEALDFGGVPVEERYQWIQIALIRFKYYQLKRAEKGLIRHYIEKVSGYSWAQVSRLIREKTTDGAAKRGLQSHWPQKLVMLLENASMFNILC